MAIKTVELLSNPRRRRRKARRRRRNPSTRVVVMKPNPRRRRRRSRRKGRRSSRRGIRGQRGFVRLPSLRTIQTTVMGGIVPAMTLTGVMLGSWSFAKTVLPAGRDVGLVGYGTNLGGGLILASIAGLVTRSRTIFQTGVMGAVVGVLVRAAGEALAGRALPFGIVSPFPSAGPYGDYITSRSLAIDGMNDYLQLPPPGAILEPSDGTYADAGAAGVMAEAPVFS